MNDQLKLAQQRFVNVKRWQMAVSLLLLMLAAAAAQHANADTLDGGDRCYVSSEGTWVCWGVNALAEANTQTPPKNYYKPVRLGEPGEWRTNSSGGICNINTGGELWCRQESAAYSELVRMGNKSNWTQVFSGGTHHCAINTADQAWCFGRGYNNGSMGNGEYGDASKLTKVDGNGWQRLMLGSLTSCGVKDDNSLWCWGNNRYGIWGDGTQPASSAEPVLVATDNPWQELSFGFNHSCGIKADNSLWCWGNNSHGQLGLGSASSPNQLLPENSAVTHASPQLVQAGTQWLDVSAFNNSSCAIQTDNSLWCWGANHSNAAGADTQDQDVLSPQLADNANTWINVDHSCAQKADESIACWGNSHRGALGNDNDTFSLEPIKVHANNNWISAAAGATVEWADGRTIFTNTPYNHNRPWLDHDYLNELDHQGWGCAVNDQNELWCWGIGNLGQQADGEFRNHSQIRKIGTDSDWLDVRAGYAHGCARKTDQTLWCWGYGFDDVNANNGGFSAVPVAMDNNSQWLDYSTGAAHTCGIKADRTMWCWGYNPDGRIGNGTEDRLYPRPVPPQQVSGDTGNWQQVSVYVGSCGVKVDGSLWCWGQHQPGTDKYEVSFAPQKVSQTDNWNRVSIGERLGCGIRSDQSMACWSDPNTFSTGGQSLITQPYRIHSVFPQHQWQTVSVYRHKICGIAADDKVYCMGLAHKGYNDAKSFPHTDDVFYATPEPINNSLDFTQIDVAGYQGIGITTNGELYCWHGNELACGQGGQATPVDLGGDAIPEVEITSGPHAISGSTTATFEFQLTEGDDSSALFECQLDGGTWQPCSSPHTYDNLAIGQHTFAVRATDLFGNQSQPVSYSWEIRDFDGEPPRTTFTNVETLFNTATWEFTSNTGVEYYCSLNSADPTAFEPCSSPYTAENLADGIHRLYVYAVDAQGQPEEPPKSRSVIIRNGWMQAKESHTCHVRLDNSLWCWGENESGQLGVGDFAPQNRPIAVDDTFDWGFVSTGKRHTCGIKTDGSLWCWGDNSDAQLGLGSAAGDTDYFPTPQLVDNNRRWAEVHAGAEHTCALEQDNAELHCWGNNASGQLGTGDNLERIQPTAIATSQQWQYLASGEDHSCAVDTESKLHCWGANLHGQLGLGDYLNRNTPSLVSDNDEWQLLALGSNHSCATHVDRRYLYCWGDNRYSQLTASVTGANANTPQQMPFKNREGNDLSFTYNVNRLAAGHNHSCLVVYEDEQDDVVFCWGQNQRGQLGNDHNLDIATDDDGFMVTAAQGLDFTFVAAGRQHSCSYAKEEDRELCWGQTATGAVGNGVTTDNEFYADPQLVQNRDASQWLTTPEALAGAGQHVCSIDVAGQLWCWGQANAGQVGDGSQRSRNVPILIATQTDQHIWLEVKSGQQQNCGIQQEVTSGVASLWCWGNSDGAQNGAANDHAIPTEVLLPQAVTKNNTAYQFDGLDAYSVGKNHMCVVLSYTDPTGLSSDLDRLFCRGNNRFGQLGDQIGRQGSSEFAPVDEADNWQLVIAGYDNTCAFKTDNTLWCWGNNRDGQLGTGDRVSTATPQAITSATDWQSIVLGQHYSCAIKQDNSAYCWGANRSGQLGYGDFQQRLAPADPIPGGNWRQLDTATQQTCGVKVDNSLWCWGALRHELPGVQPAMPATPVSVPMPSPQQVDTTTWSSVTLGENFVCASKPTANVACWGNNFHGQIGIDKGWQDTPVNTQPQN